MKTPTRGNITLMVTSAAFSGLFRLDESQVGTPDYMGLAYFWAYEYRHYLRDATPKCRCVVHDALLAAGLKPVGESPEHLAIARLDRQEEAR